MMSEDQLKYLKITGEESDKKYRLTGMYKDWYLEYASAVNLSRAIPHLADGLKPVQRRILHSMKRMDDGRYNKVANIIGHTMQFHPHGDMAIGDALVQLGQKELLVDTQGNWGNIYTGDDAAAARYIEARLSKFALDVVFNNKITEWMPSYDGRNQEPVAFPMKFPLLLAQGTNGIGVGMAVKMLPHNFNELIDASIAHLNGEPFQLLPDFPTAGMADCTNYNSGISGGRVKIRSHITKVDKKTLMISDIPYGQTTDSLIQSIISANEAGKIKISKIDDNTAARVEIVIHLAKDVSPDKTIDALYAFTACESSISPNACVIANNRPVVMGVEEILRFNTDRTRDLLGKELDIRLDELDRDWHFSSLEKLFFEEKVYRLLENDARTWDAQLKEIHKMLLTFQHLLRRPILPEDVDKLVEKPVRKISKFDLKKANEHIQSLEKEREQVLYDKDHLTEYTIKYYNDLKAKYGSKYPRRTEITGFENIVAAKVAITNAKLYVNRAEGFVGTDLKKDENAEYICDCSDLDEVIVFLKDGTYRVCKVPDKTFIGKDIIYAAVFKKKDTRTIYNVAYRDGRGGNVYVKRFAVDGVTRDKDYNLTQGKDGSGVIWFTANANGEAEVVKIYLKPRPKLKKMILDYSFANLPIKGRGSRGNLLTRYPIQKIALKEHGVATFGGQKIWFDVDIQRLSADPRGELLGEFTAGERILAVTCDGKFYTTNFDLSNRYQEELAVIEKYSPEHIFTAIYFEGGQTQAFYLKRFRFEPSDNQPISFIGESEGSYLVAVSKDKWPQVQITFGGKHQSRPVELIDAEEFIADKSFRAKGKRLTTFTVEKVEFAEPLQKEDPDADFEWDGSVDVLPKEEGELTSTDGTDGATETANPTQDSENPTPIEFHDEDAVQMTLL